MKNRFNKCFRTLTFAAMLSSAMCGSSAWATGWPAGYEGVMLQGFYWDSYNDTKWSNLTSQADELSQYFSLIWVPQSASCIHQSMGYDPVYWFSHYNSSFGSEAQLRTMISTFKAKGTGIIADVVVNHRNGVTNWTDFPTETWNGRTYKLGPEHICSNDEVAWATGQAKPTGAPDTGDNFDGARDLDHTSATVQENIKAYTKFLLEDLGYAGFRYDMVKGFGAQYVGIYNKYSKPTYSVGEYWDGQYDAVAAWINGTGKESAAFDFPLKYCINEAFASGDLTKLVWKANGTTDQPAGLIHFGYPQYSVTFIDNHDTYRDGSKFTGNVLAANAFIICSPGTPCVFLPHWKEHKAALKELIAVRQAVGVSNTSSVRVLKSTRDCYMAEVTGSKGKLVIKVGGDMSSPDGYTSSDIKATGMQYCVWSKTNGGGGGGGGEIVVGDPFKVYFDNTTSRWTTPYIHYWGNTASTWPGVAMTKESGQIWSYTVPAGTTGILFNAGDGDATKTGDFTPIANHVYSVAGDQGEYGGGGGGEVTVTMPAKLYVLGNLSVGNWTTNSGVEMTKNGNSFVADNVEMEVAAGVTDAYFTFVTTLGSSWNVVNGSDRFGAASKDAAVTLGMPADMTKFAANVSASSAYSWKIPVGTYRIVANFESMTMTASRVQAGVVEVEATEAEARYFNLQGMPVAEPGPGVYIRVRGTKAEKVLIR